MSTRSDWTARHLDRLDDKTCRLRALLLEMAVAVSVSTPKLRSRALEVCIRDGHLTSPYCTLLRVNYMVCEVAKWEFRAGDREAPDGDRHTDS